jgi:Holliday junction DNA helicase RuvA
MIGWLQGQVLHHHRNGAVVIDVHGVGYEVHVATLDRYSVGDLVAVFIYTVVRADAILLYGFGTYEDREFFEMLLVTPGVGPSTALAALRTMTTGELASAIENDDAKRVATIPGIGPKTASRIVLELKGRVTVPGSYVALTGSTNASDAIEDALRGLGYSTQEVRVALQGVTLSDNESDALRHALALLRRQ